MASGAMAPGGLPQFRETSQIQWRPQKLNG